MVVLGAGPGGYPAAFDAADRGMRVALIDENPKPGGVCLRVGCIPSKTLLHVAKLLHETEEAAQWGIHYEKPTIDLGKLRDFKAGVVNKLTGGVSQLGRGRGVEIIEGRGTLTGSNSLTVKLPDGGEREMHFGRCVVAVGSTPAVPKMFDLGDERVMDSTGALELKDVPEKLLVVGGGYIGLEMGAVYAALGSKVTVVEMTDGLLPGADRDLVKPLQTRIEKDFDRVLMSTKVEALEAKDDGIEATLSGEQIEGGQRTETFDRVLIAIGRRPNGKTCGVGDDGGDGVRPRVRGGEPADGDGGPEHPGHRRRGRRADAGPQGDPRGEDCDRDDRRGGRRVRQPRRPRGRVHRPRTGLGRPDRDRGGTRRRDRHRRPVPVGCQRPGPDDRPHRRPDEADLRSRTPAACWAWGSWGPTPAN